MANRAVIAAMLLLAAGCGGVAPPQESPPGERYRPGETVHVCGCAAGCCACNVISRAPGGRCDCNHPLRPASVVRAGPEVVIVKLEGGREKRFFLHGHR